jgi:hypothetical protein
MSSTDLEEEQGQFDVSQLLDPTLDREHILGYAPPLLEMWAAFAHKYQKRGVLKELLLRGPAMGESSVVAITAGWQPSEAGQTEGTQQTTEHVRGGFMHFLPPFHIPEVAWMTGVGISITPWQAPSLGGVRIVPHTNPEDVQTIITYEYPAELFMQGLSREVHQDPQQSKRSRERLHLDKYCTDHLIATGALPYGSIEDGADPPDFVGRIARKDRAVECTQLTVPNRREANGLFKAVRRAVLSAARESRERFTKLRGCVVYMFFMHSTGSLGLPPRVIDHHAVDEIIDALGKYDADPLRLWLTNDAEMPNRPDLAAVTTSYGCTLYAVPMAMAAPVTCFFIETGFELGYGIPTIHRQSEAWRDLANIVARKDKKYTDDLLITVGGPDADGFAFPSEEWVATLALEGQDRALVTQHLKRVRLHFWSTGRIVELAPERSEIAGQTYPGGFIPAHNLAVLVGDSIQTD